MTKESLAHLNTLTLRGYREKWGTAWHYRPDLQGERDNHYDGPVPVGDVLARLFTFELQARPVAVGLRVDHTHAVGLDRDDVVGPAGVDGVDEYGYPIAWVAQPDRMAVVRQDTETVLGLFRAGYQIHPYEEWLIDTVAALISSSRGDLGIESAGLLRGGAQAWVQVGVPETIHTPEGVDFRPHLLGVTSADGSLATGFKRCVRLVVCDNTRDAALREDGEHLKVRHSKNSGFRLVQAREALRLVQDGADAFAAEVAQLCATTVTDREWSAFLDAHIPIGPDATARTRAAAERRRDTMNRLWAHDRRVSPWQNTLFGVGQAVNTYNHWERTVRTTATPASGGPGRGSMSRAERNTANVIDGRATRDDRAALHLMARIHDRLHPRPQTRNQARSQARRQDAGRRRDHVPA